MILQLRNETTTHITTMAELLKKEFSPIRWVIRGWLPEGLAILSGPPKIGKSWFVMNLCIATSTGGYVGAIFLLSVGRACPRWTGRCGGMARRRMHRSGSDVVIVPEDDFVLAHDGRSRRSIAMDRRTGGRRLQRGKVECVTVVLLPSLGCRVLMTDVLPGYCGVGGASLATRLTPARDTRCGGQIAAVADMKKPVSARWLQQVSVWWFGRRWTHLWWCI